MNLLIQLILLAAIGSIAGLIGGVFFLINTKLARFLSSYAVAFAAGVLLTVSVVNLIPEGVHHLGDKSYFIVLVALLSSFFFEQYFAGLHHHENKTTTLKKASVPLVLLGDTVHNFIDGVAIAAAFMVEPSFGLVVALATFLHETPHEIGDFGVLMRSGWSRKKTFTANFLSSLATFPGALLVFFWSDKTPALTGVLLSVSAGVFLYLGASDFLPEVGEDKSMAAKKKFIILLLGVGLTLLLGYLFPHE